MANLSVLFSVNVASRVMPVRSRICIVVMVVCGEDPRNDIDTYNQQEIHNNTLLKSPGCFPFVSVRLCFYIVK